MKKDLAKNADLYKMNEISKKLNLTARTIRYYESEGLLGNVKEASVTRVILLITI